MKTHTSSFKEQIKLIGKEIDSRITFGDTVLGKDDLNAVTPSYQGTILKSVMKQLDIDSNVAIPIGTILKYEFGLKVNGEYEYINYGNYVVYSIEKQEDTNSYKIVCYDKLLYSMLDYVKLPITYPISIRDYINAISTVLGLKFANKSETFANYNKQIQADLYDGLGYTFRDILDELAQVTASTICLNNNDELEIRYITETGDTIDEEYLKDVNVNFGEKFGAVNTIVLSRSGDSDSVYYPTVLPTNPYEIKISDNQIMNGNDRADFLPDIYNKLNGLEFYTNDFVSTGICYYDLCDRYSVKIGDNTYSCVMFNDEVLVTQGLEENVYTELPEQTETDYKHASKDDRMINQVYIIAKKNEAEILAVVNITNQIQKEINPIKDESGSEIIIEDASNNPLTYLEIEGKSTQETRSGKNRLPDIPDITREFVGVIASAINNEITVTGTATGSGGRLNAILYFTLPSGSYKFGLTNNVQSIVFLSNTITGTPIVSTTGDYAGFTLTEETQITLGVNVNQDIIYNDNFKAMIVPSDITDYNYEPYGTSPSPEFPSEIESVGHKNIFDEEFRQGSNTSSTTSYYIFSKNTINCQKNKNYIFSTNLDTNIYKYAIQTNTQEFPTSNANSDNTGWINTSTVQLKTTIDGYLGIMITKNNGASITIDEIKNVNFQLEEGLTAHPYIPFTNGKYGIEVETVGKNLWDEQWENGYYDRTTGIKGNGNRYIRCANYIPIKPNETFYFNKPDDFVNYAILFYDNSFTKIGDISLANTTSKAFTTPSNASYFTFFGDTGVSNATYQNNIMITKSTGASEYVPYQKNTSLIVLNAPLRSLPNGVKDIAYIKNNKLYVDRYIGSLVLDGSEEIGISTSNENYSSFYIIQNDMKISSSLLSNYFTQMDIGYSTSAQKQGIASHTSLQRIYITLSKNIVSDLATFKTWLLTHNTQVDYELATPVTEELGEIEMLKTLKGYNDILTTDELLPIINLTYVRDTILADYVENHVAELKLNEKEIKTSVETVSSSVDGLNTSINRVEEITNDNSQVINIISTNIDKTSGEVREVTTTTGFTFNADGMTIDDGSGFRAEHAAKGTYYKDGNSIVGQYTKDGSKQKDLELFGTYSYGKESIDDTPMFVGQLYRDENGEECFGHFYNGGDY